MILAHDVRRCCMASDAPPVVEPEPPANPFDPLSFDSWIINAFAPPLVVAAGILIKQTFFGFLLEGFHIWVHELGHATVAWLTGKRALPLPLGWTSVADEKSLFVYFGILFLLTVLFVAGWRERKVWPMIFAIGLALVQAWMTWLLPEARAKMWLDFSGVGGEFYLAAAMMALFYVQLPEKFKWGACRYVVLFIAAGSFYSTFSFWRKVKRGEEGIPYGSMIGGEEDGDGDMNGLHDEFGWTQREIIHSYNHLGDACVLALLVVYLVFAFRLDRIAGRLLVRMGGLEE